MTMDDNRLSEYEALRARNVQANNARLRALGLISVQEEQESNALAWRKPIRKRTEECHASNNKQHSASTKLDKHKVEVERTHKKKSAAEKGSPKRKSKRLKGLQPDGNAVKDGIENTGGVGLVIQEREQRIQECRRVRQQAALKYEQIHGAAKAAKENPTATYEHCQMRVRTMSEKALRNRIKTIERAAGKHSVVKMAIFKSCLQDQDMWELAELANDALERLKALQPPPKE